MNTIHSDTKSEHSAALVLGNAIRAARKKRGLTLAETAERLGRPREWLNRIELGYSEFGETKPPSSSDINQIIDCLGAQSFDSEPGQLLSLGKVAEQDFEATKRRSRSRNRKQIGKPTQAEVIMGEEQVVDAIVDLINEQHSDAIIRNTGIKTQGSYMKLTDQWRRYREALGEFLKKNPNGVFKRLEYAASDKHLESAKQADSRLAADGHIEDVHNAKSKFHKQNPLFLHVLIGQREAILALPLSSGQAGSSIAILVRDKLVVEALRVWYDEVLWESPGESMMVDFSNFDESFQKIKKMYGYEDSEVAGSQK
jgi:transcriptional regulator with XRE-family HTH domain